MSTQTETNASMILLESITKNQYRIGGPILIMLAAIDRMFITSPSVETRRRIVTHLSLPTLYNLCQITLFVIRNLVFIRHA
ncbi:unnamed protein product [Rotaria magnacalcarata]